MRRLGVRKRLFLAVVVAAAAALALLVAGFNVFLGRSLSTDANNVLRSRASAELALLRPVNGKLAVSDAPDTGFADNPVFVFTGKRILEGPQAGNSVNAAARALAGGPSRIVEAPGTGTRFYAAPVVVGGRRYGTVVSLVSLHPYEQTKQTALIGSLALGGLLLLIGSAAAWWLIGSSLRPVARMTEQAGEWSEHDIDRRFELGPPHDELTQLAATLDGLLDRLAASLRHEQRFSAELSHELRTPLSRVIAEAELALRRERQPEEYRQALEVIGRNARHLARTVDALVAAARHEGQPVRWPADAFAVASGAAEACVGLAEARAVDVQVVQPSRPVRLGVEADLAERILQPVVENACRYGRREVRISIDQRGSRVVYEVEDDGPGVTEEEVERIFEPGTRGVNGHGESTGAGLGLALARRLARSATGEVEAVASPAGGRFIVRLPAG